MNILLRVKNKYHSQMNTVNIEVVLAPKIYACIIGVYISVGQSLNATMPTSAPI